MSIEDGIAIIALWDTKRFSTYDIGQILNLPEHAVEKTIHVRRQAARGIA